MNRLICDAIGARRLLRFIYEGYERIVEPHLHGINAASHEALSAWIVEGWSASSGKAGWRNYLVSEMHDIHVLARSFEAPRPGYNPTTRTSARSTAAWISRPLRRPPGKEMRMMRATISIAVLLALSACGEPKPDAASSTAPHSLAAAADETFEPSPGIRLRFRQAGSGEPVVLLHGFTASLEAVAPLADSLAGDHRVIALDQRGHGGSTVPADTNAYGREMGEDVVRLLDRLGIARAHLVGHSMGSIVSAYVAARHPDRVTSVSIIAPPFFADSAAAAATLGPVVAELESGGGFLAFFERFAPEMPDSIRPGGSAEMVAANDRSMLIGVMRTFPGLGPGLESVKAVGVPATVVVGSIDTLRVEARALADSWSGSRYVEVEGADHVDVFWHPSTLAAVREQIDSPAERR